MARDSAQRDRGHGDAARTTETFVFRDQRFLKIILGMPAVVIFNHSKSCTQCHLSLQHAQDKSSIFWPKYLHAHKCFSGCGVDVKEVRSRDFDRRDFDRFTLSYTLDLTISAIRLFVYSDVFLMHLLGGLTIYHFRHTMFSYVIVDAVANTSLQGVFQKFPDCFKRSPTSSATYL